MDGMIQFPGQTPEPEPTPIVSPAPTPELRPEPSPIIPSGPTLPLMLPEPRKRIWLKVLFWTIVVIVLIVGFLVYYGAPGPTDALLIN